MYNESYILYGILFECPVGKRNKDCPLIEVDYLSFRDKLIWIEKYNYELKVQIINHHKECSEKRN